MAQPPDISETFLREVDENLRRDQLRDFLQELWQLADRAASSCSSPRAAASSGGSSTRCSGRRAGRAARASLQGHRRRQAATRSPQAARRSWPRAAARRSAPRPCSPAPRSRLQQNDTKLAIAKYREIAGDSGLPQPYRDAALIRQTALEFDQLQPQEVIARLQPLAKPGNPWFGTAGEMTALALDQAGQERRRPASCSPRSPRTSSVPELDPRPRRPDRRQPRRRRQQRAPAARPSRTRHDRPMTKIFRCRPDRRSARRERLQRVQEGQGPKTPVLGQRIAVLTSEGDVEVDPATAALPMSLPAPVANTDWAQSGGNAVKSMGQLALGTALGAGLHRPGRPRQQPDGAARGLADRRRRPRLHDRHAGHRARFRRARPAASSGRARRRSEKGNERVALRRRDRLRQRPHLRDQRPRLCRRARCSATAASSGRSAPAARCAARRPSPTARST